MRVVSVDPGLAACGIAVLDRLPQKWEVVEAHTVRTKTSQPGRLRSIISDLQAICERARPHVLVVEDTANAWAGRQRDEGKELRLSFEAGAALLRVEGAVAALACVYRIPCVTIAPRVWRAHYGLAKASDARIKEFAARMFGERLRRASVHACEAALIGAAGAGRARVAA